MELWELHRNRNRSWEGKRKRGAGKKVPSPSPCSLVDSNALLPSQGKMRQHGRGMGRGWVPQADGVNGDKPCGLREGEDPHPAGTVTRGKEDTEL